MDMHGEVYAVARWVGAKTKDVAARLGDLGALPSVSDMQKQIATAVRKKLTGFIGSATDDFTQAAQAIEAKRVAMVERQRAERRDLQAKQDARWTAEALARAARFRKGIRGLWDRVTGKHAKLRQDNERETAACTERIAKEKQTLIERQLEERQRLQREIKQARHVHLYEVTRLHRQITAHRRLDEDVTGQREEVSRPQPTFEQRRRRQRNMPRP